ncbi:dynein regulatory complex protein 9-like [Trichoplusia ni]|uniref:Dynein regulatory complex protein 9 n=1 Tax=Trichoplusia ni TaxID=7111 RepID=A0A7E5W122_TRINI|nr:dynein regulatory complex protein 9-like [Trichoplusia ni]
MKKGDDDEGEGQNLFYRQASSKAFEKSNQEFLQASGSDELESITSVKTELCLPYLQSTLFACLLEDGITQLRILDECNNELRIIKTIADMAMLRSKKFEIERGTKTTDDLSMVNPGNVDSMQYKLDKLAADRIYCNEVLMGTYLELSLYRCYRTMTDSSQDFVDREAYRMNLVDEEARNKALRKELMRQLRQQRNHMKTVAYDTDLIIDQLKSRVEDAALNAETRGRYIENWQRARTEQHQQSILDKESGPSDSIEFYRLRLSQEQRIHAEVELLVNIFISDTLQKVETWMNKYDTDMEDMDLKIQIMKNKYQSAVEQREEMEQTYAYHEVLMKNWIQFKDDRTKALEYQELMTKSAIIVQAWWRGLLVRLQLGPYKPPRRRPPPPGEAKKKK